jgi:hypothetical protein
MTVTTTFRYLGNGFVFEHVKYDDGSVTYNLMPDVVLPPADPPVEPPVAALEPVLATPVPAETQCAAAPAPSKKKRTLMGVIRAAWFIVFTGAGAVVDYGIANLTDLPLPPGTATLIGGVLYGAKRAIWPSTTL